MNASNWQPIETAPKDGTHVLLAITGWDIIVGECWRGNAWIESYRGEDITGTVTNWMPLPEPPTTSTH